MPDHISFGVSDFAHSIAMEAGAADEGGPGPCPEYVDGYYAAFVRDPDAYRIEAVCHE